MVNFFLILFFTLTSSISFADTNELVFNKGNLAIFAPPVVNKDYYLIEFGFITDKKIKSWNYQYNAYVTAALFEDWLDKMNQLRAGALGFKGGVILPIRPWMPLFFTATVGFAKTALNKNPILGREGSNVASKDMLLMEVGLLYSIDKYFLRYSYQKTNVKYFTRHSILMLGVSY